MLDSEKPAHPAPELPVSVKITMKPPATFPRRRLLVAVITTIASAGIAFAGVCKRCGGSGTGAFTCYSCQGSGHHSDIKCSSCNGKGFMKCPNCNGTGQTL